jgi:hypothetical protein
MDPLDKGAIHFPGEMEQDGTGFHHATNSNMQLKTYELFISRTFHLIFLNHSQLQESKTGKSKTVDQLSIVS